MLIENSCKDFVEKLASKEPVPGGGGATALVGALAAALTSMVGNFTIGKKNYVQVEDIIQQVLKDAETIQKEMLELVDLDAKVFSEFMAVYKMPKETEEEKTLRTNALQEKAKEAALVPMRMARAAVKVQTIAIIALEKGNKDLSSDAILSGLFARTALRSAYYNVLINLQIIKNEEWKTSIKKELDDLIKQAEELEKKLLEISDDLFN